MIRRPPRSEERPVGKECRSPWSPYHCRPRRPTVGLPARLLPEPARGPPRSLWERLMAGPASTAPDGTDVSALEDLAVRVAVAAGRLVVDERPRLVEASATKSS